MAYNEEDYLQLSGLQHFRFCRRRWALIHIEKLWAENFRTTDGALLHERAHAPALGESRGDLCVLRGLNIASAELGVAGQCDVVEFRRSPDGVPLRGKAGLWQPYPVEYKRGEPRADTGDALQLCAQAMCLEEMLCCGIPEGALYYGGIRHRVKIAFSEELRLEVQTMLLEMHDHYRRGYTPRVKTSKACNACSLRELCLPKLMKNKSVQGYLRGAMEAQP